MQYFNHPVLDAMKFVQNGGITAALNMVQGASSVGSIFSVSGITSGLICPSTARPFSPHFQSSIDGLVWRGIVPAELLYPQSFLPGISEIGSFPSNTWGSLYPRYGSLTQPIPIKGSAVISQRVASIISQSRQPHIYKPLTGDSGYKYFNLGAIRPRDIGESKWQRLYPNAETGCQVFGTNDSLNLTSWGDGNSTSEEGYSWNLWRRLECCKVEGRFIGSVAF